MRDIAKLWMTAPALAFAGLVFVLPVGYMLAGSVFNAASPLQLYKDILGSYSSQIILWNTLRISALVTVLTLCIGYPCALAIAVLSGRFSRIVLTTLLVSVWVSVLVRNYAWMVMLGREGIVSKALLWMGVIDAPRSFLYNDFSVVIAMVHVQLPFMVIPILASIWAIDAALIRAAETLGARPTRVLSRVIMPLSLPGVATGVVLVFVLSLGYYVTPALLGGRGQMMFTMLIASQINDQLNWPAAAAYAAVLLAITIVTLAVYSRKFGMHRLWGAQ